MWDPVEWEQEHLHCVPVCYQKPRRSYTMRVRSLDSTTSEPHSEIPSTALQDLV